MRPSSCTAAPPEAASAAITRRAQSSSSALGRQRLVHDRHLARVDAQLGAEAEAQRALRVLAQPLVVVDGHGDAVDGRRQPCSRVAIAIAKRSGASSRSSSLHCRPVSAMKSMWPTTSRSTPGAAAMRVQRVVARRAFDHRQQRARPSSASCTCRSASADSAFGTITRRQPLQPGERGQVLRTRPRCPRR